MLETEGLPVTQEFNDAHLEVSPDEAAEDMFGGRADYDRMRDALAFIADHWSDQPDLEQVAAAAGLSPYHFQRLFSRWVGISPKKFLGFMTLARAKHALAENAPVLETALDVGLSGPGRLHDLFVTYEAMSPGEFKRQASDVEIRWCWSVGPFGETLAMVTPRGLCGLAFLDSRGRTACFEDMAARWPGARLMEDASAVSPYLNRIFAPARGEGVDGVGEGPLRIFLKGTPFQVQVWKALMGIPAGDLTTYGALAERLGMPKRAARAVGGAVALNPISWLIPCHRVIRESGMLGGYRWGLPRKVGMLNVEAVGGGLTVRPEGALG